LLEKLPALYRETAGLVIAKNKLIEEDVRDVQRYVWEERSSGRKELKEKSRLLPPKASVHFPC
jgi:hypothetical protein